MRTVLGAIVLALFWGLYALAQDYPKAEVFGGYSLLHIVGVECCRSVQRYSIVGDYG